MRKNLASFDSRQEIRTGGFELQHKRDTYLKAVELHHHDFYEIYFLVSGDVNYVIEGRLHPIKPGDLLLISPRELHQVSIQTDMAPYERYVLWLKPSEVQRLSGSDCDLEQGLNPANPQYRNQLRLSEDQRNMVRYLMEAVLRESEEEHFGSDMLKESYLQQLLVHINRFSKEADREKETVITSRMVSDIVDYVNIHYGEKLNLDTLAERFYVSKYHLSHEFRKHMGTGVYQYIQKKRLQIARGMLAEGKNAGEAGAAVGFSDYAGFYRAFVAEYGTAPKEFAASVKVIAQNLK